MMPSRENNQRNSRSMNPKVDAFFGRAQQWREEMEKLREILLDCELTEELKWGKPCYAWEGGNIVVIQPFKEYFAVLFFKGALLKDPNGILVKTGENTVAGRQIRFTDVAGIVEIEPFLRAYVAEAIEVEKAGLRVDVEANAELKLPEEFLSELDRNPALKSAFEALTPGRQRGYGFFFSAPKQSKTRQSRIEKCVPDILAGKGMHD